MARDQKIECMKQMYMQLTPQQRSQVARIASRLPGAKFALSEDQKIPKKPT